GAAALDGVDLAEVAERDDLAGRTVYAQYQRRGLGVYMAADRERKYFFSAPDRREFYFSRVEDPDETRNRAGLPFCRGAVEAARCGLVEYLRAGGYEEPLEGAGWREFPAPPDPAGPGPDAGLLVQDAPWSLPLQRIPGYTE